MTKGDYPDGTISYHSGRFGSLLLWTEEEKRTPQWKIEDNCPMHLQLQ